MDDLINPDPNGPARLLETLCAFFARYAVVQRILAMGSLATGVWDRWSDIDMIVVARGGVPAYWWLVTGLCQMIPSTY